MADKIRLVLVYMLATAAKKKIMEEVTAALQQFDVDKIEQEQLAKGLGAVAYMKQLRSLHMIPTANDMLQE